MYVHQLMTYDINHIIIPENAPMYECIALEINSYNIQLTFINSVLQIGLLLECVGYLPKVTAAHM
jgi:hypothetical protein